MYFFRKNRELQVRLNEYLALAMRTVEYFAEACDHVLEHGIDEHFEILSQRCHQEESNADDIRRQIELDLFTQSLLPESREDLLAILEQLDHLPGQADAVLIMFTTQRTELRPCLHADLKELVQLAVETARYTIEATHDCFGSMAKIRDYSRIIDNNESLGDRLEQEMITRLFREPISAGEKLLQKEFIIAIGHLCDLCERTKDQLVIWSVKRQL